MAIKRIKAKNFKSFKDLDLKLDNLNILIGANASGKSNFVEIFRFLSDIRSSGLKDAISLQGGIEYLSNLSIGSSERLLLEFVSDQRGVEIVFLEPVEEPLKIVVRETDYRFSIEFQEAEQGFDIAEDSLTLECDFLALDEQKKEVKKKYGTGRISVYNDKGKIRVDSDIPKEAPMEQEVFGKFARFYPPLFPNNKLLLEAEWSILFLTPRMLGSVFDNAVHDFYPKLIKQKAPIMGKLELEPEGSNLAIVLRDILEDKESKRKFMNLVTYLLPFLDDLDVEKRDIDRALLLKVREKYFDQYLPPNLISDGTVNMIALVVALYFGEKPLVIIEEPERNIHPYLMSNVVDMMEDASQNKQIIVTTHNPEMVRYADEKNLLLISRDEDGFSSVSRPSDSEDVKAFFKSGMRMEELYVNDLLGL